MDGIYCVSMHKWSVVFGLEKFLCTEYSFTYSFSLTISIIFRDVSAIHGTMYMSFLEVNLNSIFNFYRLHSRWSWLWRMDGQRKRKHLFEKSYHIDYQSKRFLEIQVRDINSCIISLRFHQNQTLNNCLYAARVQVLLVNLTRLFIFSISIVVHILPWNSL